MTNQLVKDIAYRINRNNELQFVTKPEIYRLSSKDDINGFKTLLEQNPQLEVCDTLYQQLKELIKIKYLSKANSPQEIEDLVTTHLNNVPLEEYGVWVYYPWLNKVVHTLDEEEFIQVRTNRNQHKITWSELFLLRSKKIGIVGLSVGQTIAFTIVLERCCGEIRLADFDDIELSNLNRLKTGLHNLGMQKIVQVAREIAELDPFIKVICYNQGITENNIDDFLLKDGKLDLLIEECDGLDIKIVSRIKAKQYGIPVVMETNDRGMVDIERYDLDPSYPMLHNIVGDVVVEQLKNLTTEQKVPLMMKLVGFNTVSPRGKATLIELGQTLSTWPQLASSVVLGGGVVTDVARRILLNQLSVSGRFYVDVESVINNPKSAAPAYAKPTIAALTVSVMEQIADTISVVKDDNLLKPSVEFIKKIVGDASTAPSSGNDQPWKFLYRNDTLYLFHDLEKSFAFGDYRNMASYTTFGGVIENIVLSAHNNNAEVVVSVFPKQEDKRCIASFTFKVKEDNTTEKHIDDGLYKYIYERCTNRKIEPNDPAPVNVLTQITNTTESVDGSKVSFITDKEKLKSIGYIISACDRMRVMNPHGHYDFFHREMRWSAEEVMEKKDGMDITTLELPQQAMIALQVISNEKVIEVLRDINGMQAFKWVSVPNAVNAAAMGLIEVPGFSPIDFINGGRAMQRQWLKCTQLGYEYQPMVVPLYLFSRLIFGNGEGLDKNAVDELKQLRSSFMQIFPGDEQRGEVLLFRIFKAGKVTKRSLRKEIKDILFT